MLSGPYGFEEDDLLAPLIGLRGPDVSINVSLDEITIMHAMHAALLPGDNGYYAGVVLRELDIRHGAAASLRPDVDTIVVTVPMSSPEVTTIRELWETLTRHGHDQCRVDGATDLVRDLDRRLGAAQAAAAERAAAGTVDNLTWAVDLTGQGEPKYLVAAADSPPPPPHRPAVAAALAATPPLRRAILTASIVAGAGGCVLGTLFWVLIFRSWDTNRALAIWIVAALAVFGVGHLVSSGLTRYARRLAAEATQPAPLSPINAGGLPVEVWDESEVIR